MTRSLEATSRDDEGARSDGQDRSVSCIIIVN